MKPIAGKSSEQQLTPLYIVATPIGNLSDISKRALEVLSEVDIVLAEDTRHSKRLFAHYGITTRLKSCHEHNEESLIEWAAQQLSVGTSLALISDAGTPLISDPGFVLVRALRAQGFVVLTVPGASSVIAALSVSGLPSDAFIYDGFLPSKSSARQTALATYLHQPRTIILLESSHRIVACVEDIVAVLGGQREIVIARELTKRFETVLSGPAEQLLAQIKADEDQQRGEFVLLLSGVPELDVDEQEIQKVLGVLMDELPLKQAASIAAKLSGRRKNEVYNLALTLKQGQ